MEIFIHNYLTRHYELATSDVGNDGIYSKEDTRRHRAPYNGSKLLKELSTIFGVFSLDAQSYTNRWAWSNGKKADLEFYWRQADEFMLPIAMRVAAQTIGLDLVSVQPMAGPSGTLIYPESYSGQTQENRNMGMTDQILEIYNNQIQ